MNTVRFAQTVAHPKCPQFHNWSLPGRNDRVSTTIARTAKVAAGPRVGTFASLATVVNKQRYEKFSNFTLDYARPLNTRCDIWRIKIIMPQLSLELLPLILNDHEKCLAYRRIRHDLRGLFTPSCSSTGKYSPSLSPSESPPGGAGGPEGCGRDGRGCSRTESSGGKA